MLPCFFAMLGLPVAAKFLPSIRAREAFDLPNPKYAAEFLLILSGLELCDHMKKIRDHKLIIVVNVSHFLTNLVRKHR